MVAVGVGGLAGSAIADSTELTVNDDGSGDYETIQAAVDEAESGDTIVVEDGTYDPFESNVENITITAADGTAPTVTASEEDIKQRKQIVYLGKTDVTFSGIDVEGPARGSGVGVRIGTSAAFEATNAEVSGVEITNVLTGIQAGSNADNSLIRGNNVSTAEVGVSVIGDSATVTGNTIEDVNTEGIGVAGTGHTFENNEFNIEGDTPDVRIYSEEVPTLNGDSSGDKVSVANTLLDSGVSSVQYNGESGVYDGSVTVGDTSYSSIQSAVNSAESGDTVEVGPGTYEESITVDTNVTLKGPNAGTPGYERGTTDLSGEAVVGSSSGPDVNVEEGANVTVDGIVFNGDQTFIESKNWSRVSVRNSIFANGRSKVNGYIWLKGSSGQFEFNSNYVVNNTASNGIRLKNPDGSRINISVRHNVWENNGAWAMNVNHVHGTIEDNTIRNTDQFLQTDRYKQWGLLFAASNNNVSIKNNTFESLTGVGVDVYGDFNGEIHVSQNTFSNITTDAGGVLISDYVPGDSEFEGFQPDVEDVNISRNNFVNNNVSIRSEVGVRINARYNYFESAPTVEGNVAYDPLLTVPADQTSSEVQDIRNYGSYIEIESDGEPTVIGFPTPTAESLSDILSDDTIEREDGEAVSIYTYDNEEQSFESVGGDYVPDAGDVLVVTTEGSLADDFVVPVDTSVTDEAATPSQVQIYEGWNLVATGGADGPDDLAITEKVLAAGQFQTQPAQPGAQTAKIGAYEGTWLFVEDDGQLTTGYVEDQTPTDYVNSILRDNAEDDK